MRDSGRLIVLCLLVAATALTQTTTPVITSLNPTSIVAGSAAFTLQVTGANFVNGTQVRVNNSFRTTQFVSSTRVNVSIPATDLTTPRTLSITTLNPGSAASAAVNFRVVSNIPAIASISPSSAAVGSGALTITVTGSGFASTAEVRIGNNAIATTFVSETQVTAVIPASEMTSPRTLSITVRNPPPINEISNAVTFQVSSNLTPTITLLSPNPVVAGGPAFTLSIVGTNFISDSFVRVNGVLAPTTFVDSAHLATPISASQIATATTISITISNPPNIVSQPATLTVTSGNVPTVESITPSSVPEGSGALTLAVTGTNFTSTSIVRLDDSNRTTTFVDSRHLNASIPVSDLAVQGSRAISVFNPPPNGGTSSSVSLTVFSPHAPIITSLSPPNFPTGSPSPKLTINGSRFATTEDDVVLVDDTPRETEFVNGTTLVATLLDSDVASPGTHTVTVRNRNGFISAPMTFTVSDQAGPVISTIDPSTAAVGDAPFTLTLTGTNFVEQSIVTIDGTPRTTTFVSPTQLRVQITSTDLASPRQIAVAVLNPDGVTSTPVPLTVAFIPPTIVSLSPSQAIGGDQGFELAISGTRFDENSIVRLNNVLRAATFDAATGRLLVPITANDLAVVGPIEVTVTGVGGTSVAATLSVLAPRINTVTPLAIAAGSDNVVLTVQGSSFLPTSQIVWLGRLLETTFDAATNTLTTTLRASDLSITGPIAVRVQNAPGVLSSPIIVTVSSPGDPRIDRLEPSVIAVGTTSAQLGVVGVNFLTGAVVEINGVVKPTEFVSANRLVATLGASDFAAVGTLTVRVRNPDGTLSAAAQLTVSAAPPGGGRRRAARR